MFLNVLFTAKLQKTSQKYTIGNKIRAFAFN